MTRVPFSSPVIGRVMAIAGALLVLACVFFGDSRVLGTEPPSPDQNRETDGTAAGRGGAIKPIGAVVNSIGMKLTLVPAGEFMMGSKESADELRKRLDDYDEPSPSVDHFGDEFPLHRVRITKPFYLGMCNVTIGQFQKFVDDTAYKTDAEKGASVGLGVAIGPGGEEFTRGRQFSWRKTGFAQEDDHPVVNVTWEDAVQFCRWLSRKEGKQYRLPTEAQWEYACRAGTATRFSNGDDPEKLVRVGNVLDAAFVARFFPDYKGSAIHANDGYVFTSPVGKFQPNAFGLFDMHGNAAQWCSDWYGAEYYKASPVDDPTGPGSGKSRVVRGSSWAAVGPLFSISAHRGAAAPVTSAFDVGFRVAREP